MRAEFIFYTLGRHPRSVDGGLGDLLESGMQQVAEAFFPRPVRYRTLDFKSNEMRGLLDGERYEKVEGNPGLGLRGASRYRRDRDIFLTELEALRRVREMGLENLHPMVPFVRDPDEIVFTREAMREVGLSRTTPLWAMIEVPAMIHMIAAIAPNVDGVSIGTNDLTQLLLGVDRDNPDVANLYDDAHPAVIAAATQVVESAKHHGIASSICGDAPSRQPTLLRALVAAGIDSISVPPDSVSAVLGAV
jgi:pyruvate,water dikinase